MGTDLKSLRYFVAVADARSVGKAPQLHNPEFLAAASPAFLHYAIRKGRPPTKMPAFEQKLSAAQIDDLVTWLHSLRSQPPALPRAKAVVPSDLPLVIHVRCKKRTDTGEIVNEVKGFSKKDTPPPVATAPVAGSTPPWKRS